ncbi:hypothetical protein F7725_002336 [Dissostichus mawsoni]|uniref:Uncharacterized protein n=1 Tax=Dissostichus mawsoni TaxID=36200 RepID=A0A7J5Y4B9_DISMA|nr:hypothetical protein F7725_002336 [Dissostichus mawsoni]
MLHSDTGRQQTTKERVPGDFSEFLISVWGCRVFSCWLDSSASLSTGQIGKPFTLVCVSMIASDHNSVGGAAERLQARDQLINQLKANLTEKTREVDRLQSLMDKRECFMWGFA